MKKLLLLVTGLVLLCAGTASAQFNYTVTVQSNQAYTPMTSAPSFNDTTAYNDIIFIWLQPATFPLDHQQLDTVWILFENLIVNRFFGSDLSPAAGFQFTDADLTDKAYFSGAHSLSPLHFEVAGTAPNRILKLEMTNLGFVQEHDLYGTLNDYVNVQFWIYEANGVTELRYGPSQVSHFSDYFSGGSMGVGFYHDIDFVGGGGTFYYLTGNPAAPGLDSTSAANLSVPNGLSSWPASGTTYRFQPKPLGVATTTRGLSLNAFPSHTSSLLQVDCAETAAVPYRIISPQGTVVQQGQLLPGRSSLDVSSLAAGNYILLAKGASGLGTFKFVKE